MDYKKHYDLLILTRSKMNRSKKDSVYYEQHHITPKSMGGNNDNNNLILLTAREHFLAHWLLYRIYNNRETASAFWRMCQNGNNNMKRYITSSRVYEEARIAYILNNKGKEKHTEESKKNIGLKNKKPKPTGYKEKISQLMKEGLAEKIGKSNKGISRNKGRKITWDNSKPIKIYEQYDVDGNLIKTFYGYKDFTNTEYNINGVYNAIKNNKIYKNYNWKRKN